jgi:hypothetical protein
MAHFAELNENNIVQRVLVVDNKNIIDENNQEQESIGVAFLQRLFGENTIWKQCSYNNNFRGRYPLNGYEYDENLDAFIGPKPYPSWSLNTETTEWEPPTPRPPFEEYETYGKTTEWNEDTLQWDFICRDRYTGEQIECP